MRCLNFEDRNINRAGCFGAFKGLNAEAAAVFRVLFAQTQNKSGGYQRSRYTAGTDTPIASVTGGSPGLSGLGKRQPTAQRGIGAGSIAVVLHRHNNPFHRHLATLGGGADDAQIGLMRHDQSHPRPSGQLLSPAQHGRFPQAFQRRGGNASFTT